MKPACCSEPMRILVMNGAGGDGLVALMERAPAEPGDDRPGLRRMTQTGRAEQPGRGGATRLAGLLRELLGDAGWMIGSLGLIAVVTGPGSFTGLRATLALAQGIALGSDVPLEGVTQGEALARTASRGGVQLSAMPLWCACMARRDRVFLERADPDAPDAFMPPEAFMLDALPVPPHPVRLAGDASSAVAARIEAAGGQAFQTGIECPEAWSIAAVALDRLEGRLASAAALPLYIDPPEARLPAAGLRPPPE